MATGKETMSDAILSVEHLSMKFGGLVAVNDLTFEARRGEITALIGPNGAGKTTVFNCITGFYKPTEGMLNLKRKNGETFLLERMPDFMVNRNAKVARTFQNIRLFTGLTLLENLLVAQHNTLMKASGYTVAGLFGMPTYKQASKESVEKARRWLERIGLVDRADQPAGDLPYGAQRRLEIARAMCTDPELLCLDEPAAGLNPRESAELNQLLTAIPKETGTSILLIEHDMSVVMEISDHVVVLEYGTKISDGTPKQVQSDPKVIAAYLGVDEDEASSIVTGSESVVEGFDGEPDPAHAPRMSSSMMAGPVDETIGHSAGGEMIKVGPGASRAARVSAKAKPAKESTVKTLAAKTTNVSAKTKADSNPASLMAPPAKPAVKASASTKPVVTAPVTKAPTVKNTAAKVEAAKSAPVKAGAAKAQVAKPAVLKASAKPTASKTIEKSVAKVASKPVATKASTVKASAAKAPAKAQVAKSAILKTEAKPTASKTVEKSVAKVASKPVANKAAPAKALPKSVAAKPATKAAAPKMAAKAATKTAAAKATPEKPATKSSAAKSAASKSATKATVKPVASQAVKASAKPAPKAKPEKPAQPKKPDDLKLIKGIGPVNDRKLRAHGITTFAQIAAWKKADVIAVEKYLEFDGRIAREDWIGQAKNLAKGGKPLPGGEK